LIAVSSRTDDVMRLSRLTALTHGGLQASLSRPPALLPPRHPPVDPAPRSRALFGAVNARVPTSEPVARTIEKALVSLRPRARYTVGFDARLLVPLHAVAPLWLSDWVKHTVSGLPRKAPARAAVVKEWV
jgi:hypothetical protein